MEKFMPVNILPLFIMLSLLNPVLSDNYKNTQIPFNSPVAFELVKFIALDASTWISSTGVFNQDRRTINTPGFEWPLNSNKFAIFTTGLSIAAMVGGQFRMAAAFHSGEYLPGYIVDSSGFPAARTDSRFKIYRVRAGDNGGTNPDWLNWGNMVSYGAPYTDFNHNNIYESNIDTPGVRGAYETIFLCMTDGFPQSHTLAEGFGGGTLPLYAEVHMLGWSINNSVFDAVQFFKWEIINKNNTAWNSTYFSIGADPDLGGASDDYIGCDTTLRLGFCYNGDNYDTVYGTNPPAVAMLLLEGAINKSVTPNKNLWMSSFVYFTFMSSTVCENDPIGEPLPAYYMMKGLKKDQTPWVIPPGGQSNVTKYCYSGDPETASGWNEGFPGSITGSIQNCGGPNVYTGQYITPNTPGDRRMVMSSGAENFTVQPGEKQTIAMAQFILRGYTNRNAVTQAKIKSQVINQNYLIGINKIDNEVPKYYSLYQNYPNPFNPLTKIKFDVTAVGKGDVKLIVYDALGREAAVLINEQLKAGTYEAEWNASNYPSGVYFYKLTAGKFTQTKKMVLIK
jgi:hypothetical protein